MNAGAHGKVLSDDDEMPEPASRQFDPRTRQLIEAPIRGASLDAALTYSNAVFAGAVLLWLFNSLANIIRGTGNMAVPTFVNCLGAAVLIPLSPCLIFGWGPFPRLAIMGGAIAVIAFYAVGTLALTLYLLSSRSLIRLVKMHYDDSVSTRIRL